MVDQTRNRPQNRDENRDENHDVSPLKRERHFLYWMLLTFFSLISLVAMTRGHEGPWDRPGRWVISVAAISLGLSTISALATLFMTSAFAATTELAMVSVD